jgi:hypothetical protein
MNAHFATLSWEPEPPAPRLRHLRLRRHQRRQALKARPIPAWAEGPGSQTTRSASALPKAGVQPQAERQNCLPQPVRKRIDGLI